MNNAISILKKLKPNKKEEEIFAELKADIRTTRFDHTYENPLHFLSFLSDEDFFKGLSALKKEKDSPMVKTVFVVGIGGANLGAEALIDALSDHHREFVFIDTVYPGEVEDLYRYVEHIERVDEFLLIIISKSGETLETLTNAKLLYSLFQEKFADIGKQVIVVSADGSPLTLEAKEKGITCVHIPHAISDRFAVFSAVGLVPLLFTHFSIDSFVLGGVQALHEAGHESIVWNVALLINNTFPSGMHGILDFFLFSLQLETFGKWNKQLFAESLGKETTIDGTALNRSITPTVSIGTTDLHSMLQLYLAQPHERAAWFFTVHEDVGEKAAAPEVLLSTIYKEVVGEYIKHKIPFAESRMDSISLESFGYHMMNSFLVVLALSRLWNVDPFNQPNVDEYKSETRMML